MSARVVLLLFLFFIFPGIYPKGDELPQRSAVRSLTSDAQTSMFKVGEELSYRVSYAFFNLGTIRIQVIEQKDIKGRSAYLTRAFIDSNPSLRWFVDLHFLFESIVDKEIYSYSFLSVDSTSKEIVSRLIRFDYEAKRALIDLSKKPVRGVSKLEKMDTVRINSFVQDGLSLFFYAREHVKQKKKVTVPTIIDDYGEVNTFINFMNKRTSAEIDALDYEVDVVEFDGRAEYVGIYGMTGGFRGWFSNDQARVPIRASMNVILGSVKIELERWDRSGWSPPRYMKEIKG